MSTAKEKKLNEIKSEILEITNFVTSNKKAQNSDIHTEKKIKMNSDDTLTLTNIVNSEHKVETKDDLTAIKNELFILKSMLTKQEIVLKEILLKIK
ncbi:hypothetical protein OA505_03575 [Alphaproteobacteria bacterium]|nr:hypothetical protein [Alphaproteobacteria bacterium]